MASTPIKNAMIAKIREMGGVEAVISEIAGGETVQSMAAKLGVSRPFLSGYLHSQPIWSAKLETAKKMRAAAFADAALHLADGVAPDPNAINKAKLQIETRKWLAGIDDPEGYGPKGQKVEVNIGTLHLDALRKFGKSEQGGATIEGTATEVPDAEA